MKGSMQDEEIEIDLVELIIAVVHKFWLVFLVGAGVAGGCYYLLTKSTVPSYQADTTIYVLSHQDQEKLSLSDMQTGDYLTSDYQGLIKSRKVLEKVISELELESTYKELYSRTVVTLQKDTRILTITVQDENPDMAVRIANTIRTISTEYINEIMRVEAVTPVDEAKMPADMIVSPVKKKAAIAGLIASVFVAGVVGLLHLFNQKILSDKELESKIGIEVLATIPEVKEKKVVRIHKKKLIKERKSYMEQIAREEEEYQNRQRTTVIDSVDAYEGINT